MLSQFLVVSDPPHRSVDHAAVGAILDLAEEDVRLKVRYGAPEVLWASDEDPATDAADSLRSAGMSVVIIDGAELATVPWPTPASWFAFEGDALTALVADRELRIPYQARVSAVYCRPPAGAHPGPAPSSEGAGAPHGDDATPPPGGDGRAISEAMEWMSLLDLYYSEGHHVRRVTLARDLVDFTGLADLQGATREENLAATLSECEGRFPMIHVDRRLENVRPRHRFVMGDAGFDLDLRKLYSFGTLLLRQVLDSISPELRDLTQYELGSRLSYVTRARKPGR